MLTKIIATLVVLALMAMLIFPLSEYHFGYFAGGCASLAFLLAIGNAYRTQEYVRTRGGIIYKNKNPIRYFFAHFALGLFGFGLFFICTLGVLGLMR
jgi:hypothetical protein